MAEAEAVHPSAAGTAALRPSAALTVSLPIVAIVGRPNVGKSTLFNRIVGERAAIVEDRARTTRDRLYGDAEWNDRRFVIVDTGGLEIDTGDPIEAKVQEQARLAIAEADVIVFVVDAASGLTPADEEAAETLRRAAAPVLVAANKADSDRRELDANEFYALGWDDHDARQRPPRPRRRPTCSTRSSRRCRQRATASSSGSAREAEAEQRARDLRRRVHRPTRTSAARRRQELPGPVTIALARPAERRQVEPPQPAHRARTG